jgi:hypothetical protein
MPPATSSTEVGNRSEVVVVWGETAERAVVVKWSCSREFANGSVVTNSFQMWFVEILDLWTGQGL